MKLIIVLVLALLGGVMLLAESFAQDDDAQQRLSGVPSVYQHGFAISHQDRTVRIGNLVIKPAASAADGRAAEDANTGLFLLLLNEAGQPDSTLYTKDFNELLRTFPDRMVIGISIQAPDSEYNDQFFFGRLKADLTGLTIAEFAGDVYIQAADLSFPPMSDSAPENSPPAFTMGRVAHAGGGLDKLTYTNSYEALDENIKNGFEYFEIDFVFTSDMHLVCLHDWDVNFERTFGFANSNPLSLAAFRELVAANDRFKNCTLDGLADWMEANPGAYLVTDVKDDNLQALERISNTLPDAARRVIPQIYHAWEYDAVKALGFEQIIWTLYRIAPSDLDVIHQVATWEGPIAVAMPREWADSGLALLLQARGVPAYAHTVNSAQEQDRLTRELGFTDIYTDFLAPEHGASGSP